ncbi:MULTISPECIES: hypothetical protein [Bacillus]|uniref:Uncharacterized protein n=1 Tax=Bacillus subtilis TaxID=1423 RepID=A0AC61Z3N6_BACIU|nr:MULTISPECIES: hypothetical protein [Bacillus]WIT27390.1 hypothetical protein [Bacillus phage SPbetaL4]KDE22846.1 hypothetical protein EF83_15670 [Bacillus subtilis]QXW83639.1 hypothetical protein KXZ66_10070 [Bacillus sp. LJBS17]WGE06980.1 hypothetical protein P5658_17795 [Bacillus subtilis]CAF1813735.1 hypothetical protein NRS6148_01090 [Bacillus subtilis]
MEVGDKIHNANEKITALEKKKYQIETTLLEKQRDLLRLETQQNKEKLKLLFELSEVLTQLEDEEWVSCTIALRIIRRNKRKYLNLFELVNEKAYINKDKFKVLHDEFFDLKQQLNEI